MNSVALSPAVLAAMREIDAHAQVAWRTAEALRPPTGTVGVGAADFDYALRATLAEAYLRDLRQGQSPAVARHVARAVGDQIIRRHNDRRIGDVNWKRAEGSEDAFLQRRQQDGG